MNKKKFTKLLALYLPYLVIGLAATNLGESWRLAEGKELGDKIVSLIDQGFFRGCQRVRDTFILFPRKRRFNA